MKSELTIDKYGTKQWILPNGRLHREDGPALESLDGAKSWHKNGYYHRENGPAVEYTDGSKAWCLEGVKYSEKDYKIKMRTIKLKRLL